MTMVANDEDDAYLRGMHSPTGWSKVLYWSAAVVLGATIVLAMRLLGGFGDGRSADSFIEPEGVRALVVAVLVGGGLVSSLLLAGLAALLRWVAYTFEVRARAAHVADRDHPAAG
jgi:hypothetical protein